MFTSLHIVSIGPILFASHAMPDLITPALQQAVLLSLVPIAGMAATGASSAPKRIRFSARAFILGALAGLMAVVPGAFLALQLLSALSQIVAQIGFDGIVASYYVCVIGGASIGTLVALLTSRSLTVHFHPEHAQPISQLLEELKATCLHIDSVIRQLLERKGHRSDGDLAAKPELAQHVLSDSQMENWTQVREQQDELSRSRSVVHEKAITYLEEAKELLRDLETS